MTHRSALALAALLALAGACTNADTPALEETAAPTAPSAPRASVAAAPAFAEIDTTEASSVCRAVVRQRGTAIAKLDTEQPGADERAQASAQATALDAMAADVCH